MPVHNWPPLLTVPSPAAQLAKRGFLLPIEVAPPQAVAGLSADEASASPSALTGVALVDTGASRCCVEETVLDQPGLEPVRRVTVRTPNGSRQQYEYIARLSFPGTSILAVELPIIAMQMGAGEIIGLVGRDFLRRCVLVYNGVVGSCSLAF